MDRKGLSVLSVLAGILTILALTLSRAEAMPASGAYAPHGIERAGSTLCRCPTTYGDCPCDFSF